MKTRQQPPPQLQARAQVAGASWPLKCICNLCQCGGHRCSNFSWSEQLAGSLARRLDGQQEGGPLNQEEDEAFCYQANNRSSSIASERYLTTHARRPKSRADELDGSQIKAAGSGDLKPKEAELVEDQALLHVLVTRPEIAGKPRDNIIFEGDMDLRTTFETSYEALARMRLEHWRRHQEQVAAANENVDSPQMGAVKSHRQSVSVDKQRAMNRLAKGSAQTTGGGGGGGKLTTTTTRHRRRQPTSRSVRQAPTVERDLNEVAVKGRLRHGGGGLDDCENVDETLDENQFEDDEQLIDEFGDKICLHNNQNMRDTPSRQMELERHNHSNQGASSPQMGRQLNNNATDRRHVAAASPVKQLVSMSSPISRVRTPSPLAWNDETETAPAAADRHQQSAAAAAASATPTPARQQLQSRPAAGLATVRPSGLSFAPEPESELTSGGQTTNDALIHGSNATQTTTAPPAAAAAGTATPIDADLAPLICYDANMNRLERVGLRKRSKYRPSTSLRSGARGLFGDATSEQQLESAGPEVSAIGGNNNDRSEQIAENTMQKNTETTRQMGAAGATSRELDWTDNANVLGKRHLLNHAGRMDHIKEQNIVEHKQDERQFEDKATLTERLNSLTQRIGGGEQTMFENEKTRESQTDTQIELNELQANSNELKEEAARLLAEAEAAAEESAVVAEIQRCTREAPEMVDQRAACRSPSAAPSPQVGQTTASVLDSRQSRQQRVCQHQSFNINENEYPAKTRNDFNEDYCIKIGGRETAASLAASSRASNRESNSGSPYARGASRNGAGEKAKNLFRESPDFILTTGNGAAAMKKQQQQRSVRSLTNVAESASPQVELEQGGGGAVRSTSGMDGQQELLGGRASRNATELTQTMGHAAGSSPCPCTSSCRVLNLDNRYEFVGSRMGHKYFMEREANVRESLLISETA